jgi:hypothetical protein
MTGSAAGTSSAGTVSAAGAAAGARAFGGAGGSGGAPTAGAGGAMLTEVACSFEISGSISPQIPTVGVVDWSTDLAGLTAARIEFSLDDPKESELNVASGGPISASEPRALLLGLKPERPYTYRIVATAGNEFCVSKDQTLKTHADPDAPALTSTAGESAATRSNGFIVACMGSDALIIDSDGVVVWWIDARMSCSRAHLDWAGDYLWTMSGGAAPSDGGVVTRTRMDGSAAESIAGLERAHHDFAVLPGGISAFLLWTADEVEQSSALVERSPDGTLRTVATLDDATLLTSASQLHANALRYYARDDSYTVSDLNLAGISKLNRQGEVEWQLRSGCEAADSSRCAAARLVGNHGHQLLENGNLLLFSTNFGAESPATEYRFSDEAGFLTATVEWSYTSSYQSEHYGDVQRLPNGNTLVTYSWNNSAEAGELQCVIQEVTPMGTVARSVTGAVGGYSAFRATLYGPPQ